MITSNRQTKTIRYAVGLNAAVLPAGGSSNFPRHLSVNF